MKIQVPVFWVVTTRSDKVGYHSFEAPWCLHFALRHGPPKSWCLITSLLGVTYYKTAPDKCTARCL